MGPVEEKPHKKMKCLLNNQAIHVTKGPLLFLNNEHSRFEVTHTVALDYHTHSFGEQRSTFTKTKLRA